MNGFASGPLAAQTSESNDPNARLNQTQLELRSTIDHERALATDAVSLERERASINAELIDLARRIQEGENKLTELEGRLGELGEQKKLLVGSLSRENRNLGRLLAALQRMGRNPPPVIATPEGDALSMVRSAMLLATVFPELRGKAETLTAQLGELNRVVAEFESRSKQLRVETDQLRAARTDIAGLLDTKKRRLIDTQTELAEVRRIAEQHRRSVASLNELIVKLDRTVSEKAGLGAYEQELANGSAPGQNSSQNGAAPAPGRRLPEDPLIAPAENASNSVTVARAPPLGAIPEPEGFVPEAPAPAARLPRTPSVEIAPNRNTRVAMLNPGRIKPALPFGEAQGTLAIPARGKRLWGFGDKTRHGSTSKGLAIETRNDAQITSPNDGWVVFAGPFLSYGQLLIVNAGGGYHILLAGMSSVDVVVGQFVLKGEPVGTMAHSPVAAAPAEDKAPPVLYVEFRKKGKPIDPDPWWADAARKVQG